MSKLNDIFTILSNGTLDINKVELRGHIIFKPIIALGKKAGLQNLLYIYLMKDPRSIYIHLSEEERHKSATKHIGEAEHWLVPAVTRRGLEAYEDLITLSPSGKSFLTANKALYEIGSDLDYLLENTTYFKNLLRNKVTYLKSKNDGDKVTLSEIDECNVLIEAILKNASEINKQINELPKMNITVEKLAVKWANESNGKKEIYGGGELGNRE